MKIVRIAGLALATAATLVAAAAPATARPHRHRVCHMERHHGHPTRVCRWH